VCLDLAFGPDWRIIAGVLIKDTGRVCLWNTFNGQQRFPLKQATVGSNSIFCVAISPDGATLASGWRGDLHLWSLADGSRVASFGVNATEQFVSMAFAPAGDVLVTGSSSGSIRLWRVADQTLIRTLGSELAPIRRIALSPDGALIASGHDDGTVLLWETESG
jgi:WD40 repeat protein